MKAKEVDIDDATTLKKTVKKLKAGKKYTFKVCPMTEIANMAEPGTSIQVYGQWSDVMKVKAKK